MLHQVALAVGVGTLLLVITAISYLVRSWVGTAGDYVLAGREVSASLLAAGVLAFGFATDIAVLFAIFGISYGYYPSVSMGVVYVAWMLYGLGFVKLVRTVGTSTITELYEIRFNYATRAAVSLTQVLAVVFMVSAGSLGAASIVNGFAGWPVVPTVLLMLAVVAAVVMLGGLWGVTVSNVVLTLYGLVVFPAVLVYLLTDVGGLGWLVANVPEAAPGFAFPGGWELFSLGTSSYLTWTTMWFVALVYGSSYYWTRAGSARSDRAARNGFLAAGVLGLLLMTVVMPLLGMFAFALAPEAYTVTGGSVPPAGAFGVLATTLPLALGVLVPIGFVAASVSTYTTTVVAGTALVLKDFYVRVVNPDADPEAQVAPSRLISLLVLVVAFLLTLVLDVQTLVTLFLTMLGISSAIVLVDQRWKVMTPQSAAAAAILAVVAVFGWTLGGFVEATGVHQLWVALGTTLGVGVVGGLLTENRYYARDDWAVEPSPETVEAAPDLDLDDDHHRVLASIATGGDRLADLLDALQLPSDRVNDRVEELDRHRYLHRRAARGHGFYRFALTAKGREAVHGSDVADEAFREHRVDEAMRAVLRVVDDRDDVTVDVVADAMDASSSDVVAAVGRLLRLDYLAGEGRVRRKLRLTEQGSEVLGAIGSAEEAD